jgi:hypothetical protein
MGGYSVAVSGFVYPRHTAVGVPVLWAQAVGIFSETKLSLFR